MLKLLLLSVALMGSVASDPLAAYLWKKRVLVVFAARPDDPRLAAQRAAVTAAASGGDDRDLVMLEVVGPRDRQSLQRRFDVSVDHFVVLLVGKDGGVKFKVRHVVASRDLADVIDAMPMRRDDVRKAKGGS